MKEGVYIFLIHICLALVEKVQQGHHICRPGAPHKNQSLMGELIRGQQVPEERTGRCQDDFVCWEFLAIFAHQSYICQVPTLSQLSKMFY